MRGVDRGNTSSDGLLGAAVVFPTASLPSPKKEEPPAVFPVKEEIYDLDYPELQELQDKLMQRLHDAKPTSPRNIGAASLLNLVKLEIQEREACAFMLNNILSVQNCASGDGQNENVLRSQKQAEAPSIAVPSVTGLASAEVATSLAEYGKSRMLSHFLKTASEGNDSNFFYAEKLRRPSFPARSKRESCTLFSNLAPPRNENHSWQISPTVTSTGTGQLSLTSSPSVRREGSTLRTGCVTSALEADLRQSVDKNPPDSTLPRSRVSNFTALEKKLFGNISPAPTCSPPQVPRCELQAACAPLLKFLKRGRRKEGTSKFSVPRGGAEIHKKSRRRKRSDEQPPKENIKAPCSVERRSFKRDVHIKEAKTATKVATILSNLASPRISLAKTHSSVATGRFEAKEASAPPQDGKSKCRRGKEDFGIAPRDVRDPLLEEQSTSETFDGRQKPTKDPCTNLKVEALRECKEERTFKPQGGLNIPLKRASCMQETASAGPTRSTSVQQTASTASTTEKKSPKDTEQRLSEHEIVGAGCETFTASPRQTSSTITDSKHSGVKTTRPSVWLPHTDAVNTCGPAPPVEQNSKDCSSKDCWRTPASGTSPDLPQVKSGAPVHDEEKQTRSFTATETPATIELVSTAGASGTARGRAGHRTSSQFFRSRQEKGRRRFSLRLARSCTEDYPTLKGGVNEVDVRDKTKSPYTTGSTAFCRYEEEKRQRSHNTSTTRKKIPVKQKEEEFATGLSLSTGAELDILDASVYHELAHMSIRNSAQGVIDNIDTLIQAMNSKTSEQQQQSETMHLEWTASATTTTITAPTALVEAPAQVEAQEVKKSVSANMPCLRKDEQPDTRTHPGQAQTSGAVLMHPVNVLLSTSNELHGVNKDDQTSHFSGDMEENAVVNVDAADASMEKVYALLACLEGQPSTKKLGTTPNRSLRLSAAFGWKIQFGNTDDVDAVCQTISIKESQENEVRSTCLMVEEGRLPSSRQQKDAVEQPKKGSGGSGIQEKIIHSSPSQNKSGFPLLPTKHEVVGDGEALPVVNCVQSKDTSRLLEIQRQFPSLADLLTENDKSKHASLLREILVNNGKCCADLSQLEATLGESKCVPQQTPEDTNNCVLPRFYKVEHARPEVFKIVCQALRKEEGWEALPAGQHWEYAWNLLWTWRPPRINYNKLLSFQKVNHFPEGRQLTRKDNLKRCIERYQRLAGKSSELFNIIPKTYALPKEYTAMFNDMCDAQEKKGRSLWICKPKDSSRGRGIYLADSIEKIRCSDNILVQEYIANPLLLNGRKFDLRLYVLVTSFNPLEAFIYKQGFARVARVPFSLDPQHLENRFMHLTNASVQTKWQSSSESEDEGALQDVLDDEPPRNLPGTANLENRENGDAACGKSMCGESSKLLLDELKVRLEQSGLDWETLWNRIVLVILKSLSCCSDFIPFQPNSFELFGYDILVDAEGKPWLIEVNSSPCMSQEYDVDRKIKPALIEDSIRLLNPVVYDRFKLSSIIAGRLSEACPRSEQSTSLVSPRRSYPLNHHTNEFPVLSSVSSSATATPSSPSSSSAITRGPLTHRPSRKAMSDAKNTSEDWRISRRTRVKKQHQQDLVALFTRTKPREYGEMPVAMGLYERIAPSKTWYQLQVLKHSLLGKH